MYAFDFYKFIVVTFGIVQLAWLNTLTMTSRYKNENKKVAFMHEPKNIAASIDKSSAQTPRHETRLVRILNSLVF